MSIRYNKIPITTDSGATIEAQSPVIVSAGRSTDIPAFYSQWFINRLNKGYTVWYNPFNQKPIYISLKDMRVVVFWSKNPKPLIPYLKELNDRGIHYYFQFTLNDYEKEGFEPNVPSLEERIHTFCQLSDLVGKEKVIWRFDPLILTDKIGIQELLRKIENAGNQIKNYTQKLVFSFADIGTYRKVQAGLKQYHIPYREFDEQTMKELARGLQQLNENWHFELATCAEKITLKEYDITKNKCVDDDLIIKLFSDDKVLMDFLGVKIIPGDIFNSNPTITKIRDNKDKGQRKACRCISSKDIGMYNTCPHYCVYCYANTSKEAVKNNLALYDNKNESIISRNPR